MAKTALVSCCLLGLATRYDGTDNFDRAVINYLQQQNLVPIPVCPEQLAGLPTPRLKCWFSCGDGETVLSGTGSIRDENHQDMTAAFLRGAHAAAEIAGLSGCQLAILKQRSPSCGSRQVYRNGELVDGSGVTAAKLREMGLKIISEEDLAPEPPRKLFASTEKTC